MPAVPAIAGPDVELRVTGRHVGDEGMRIADVAAHPGLHVAVRGVRGDHPEPVAGQLGHGEIGFQRAAGVEPLGVGDLAGLAVHLIGGDPLQHAAGVASLHVELGHEGHVHQDHAVAPRDARPPGSGTLRPPPGQFARIRLCPLRRVPVRALPPAHVPEIRPLRLQPL